MYEPNINIMFRKVKNYSGRNSSCGDPGFYADLDRISAKKARREQFSEYRWTYLHGSPEEKANTKSRINLDAKMQVFVKEQKVQMEKNKSLRENRSNEEYRSQVFEKEQQRNEMKNRRLREAQEFNRIAALEKKFIENQKKIVEKDSERQILKDGYYRFRPNVF